MKFFMVKGEKCETVISSQDRDEAVSILREHPGNLTPGDLSTLKEKLTEINKAEFDEFFFKKELERSENN